MQQEYIFLCEADGKPLILTRGKYSYYRRCGNYLFSNRNQGEKICMNRMYLREVNALREELMKRECEEGLSSGDTGKCGNIVYRIGRIDRYRIEVFVKNTRFLESERS